MSFHLRICALFLLICCITISCTKDQDLPIDSIDNIPEVKEKIFATFNGLILTEDDQVIEGAFVAIDTESGTTDVNGYFSISGFFNPDGAPIRVTMDGYFDGSGLLIPYPDVAVNTKLKLISKTNSKKEGSNKAFDFNTDLATISFKENSFTANGVQYDGIVELVGTSLDVSDPEYALYSPGTMDTYQDGVRKSLFPYGRINVEMYSEAGVLLDINAPASISFDIADALVNEAPEEITLWYLNTDTGLWVADGQAVKSGNEYIGEVSHFTDWCVARDFNIYTISGTVMRNGEIYADANMGVTVFSYRFPFRSASDGSYSTRVFDFESITLDVSNECGEHIYSQDIQSPSADLVEDIEITKTENSFVVSGNIFCDSPDNRVGGGYVLLTFNDNQFSEVVTTDETGAFSFFYEDCGNQNVKLRGYDPVESKQSSQVSITGNSENLELDVCKEEITGSIRIELNGEEPYIIPGCTVDISILDGFPGGYQYVFRATDNFSSLPEAAGEFVHYEILVNVGLPGELPPPFAPISTPLDGADEMSANPPFFFDVVPADVTVLSENDEVVVIKTNDRFPISKFVGNTRTEYEGQIILEGIKN